MKAKLIQRKKLGGRPDKFESMKVLEQWSKLFELYAFRTKNKQEKV